MPRLILIDDEPDFRAYVAEVATGMGFDVVVTDNGETLRDAYRAATPDVVVLDIVMPDEDGIELLHWLAVEGYEGQVLIVSGYNPQYARIASKIGTAKGMTVKSLPKPIRLAELRKALEPALHKTADPS